MLKKWYNISGSYAARPIAGESRLQEEKNDPALQDFGWIRCVRERRLIPVTELTPVSLVPSRCRRSLWYWMSLSPRTSLLDFKRVTENDKVSAVIGGSKVSTKSPSRDFSRQDTLVLCRLAFTSQGTGYSLEAFIEESMVETAKELEEAERTGKTIVLPCRCRLPKRSQIGHEERRYQDL
jgi:hypothetical protein